MTQRKRASEPETDVDAAAVETGPEEEMAMIAPIDSYEPIVREPVEEAPEAQPEEVPIVIPEGHVQIVYRAQSPGGVLSHGDYKFRSGQPVIVPSEVAEELLTTPFEVFERL